MNSNEREEEKEKEDFIFKITSLDDFIRFCEAIRGKELDSHEIKKLTKDLGKSDDALTKAIHYAEGKGR